MLQSMLENNNLELVEKSDEMMTMKYSYINFNGKEYAAGCPDKAKGIWVQLKRDASKRNESNNSKFQVNLQSTLGPMQCTVHYVLFQDLMNGKKTRDWYYLQLKGLNSLDQQDVQLLHKCLKTGKVFRIEEEISDASEADFTKCTAYKACNKEPDWLDAVATTTTEFYTTTPYGYDFTPDDPY